MPIPRLISFYLPQFYPIPENDEWWGRGFTEWTNVAAAQPSFRGHHQPQIPADLGFYDLRLAETREAQAALAKQYGIHGFCYYHYWFKGEQLLERPFNEVLASNSVDLPFCLCWANHSWTRAWDGLERQILKKQDYSAEDNQRHIDWLIRAFQDERYIRIEGKPLFIFFRLHDIPEAGEMIRMWRAEAARRGLPGLYLCAMRTGHAEGLDAELIREGVDAVVDFQPNPASFPVSGNLLNMLAVIVRRLLPLSARQNLGSLVTANRKVDYSRMVDICIDAVKSWPKDYTKFPCVFPSWDNSARRKGAMIIQNDDPESYRKWLEASIAAVRGYDSERQVVFINAWNEWAEGCHLEPDRRNGHAFLAATSKALAAATLSPAS
jgi:lipopolysaccharide biosynthesis protein